MNSITVIGLIAAILTTSAYVPQVIKSMKTKSAKDLSLGTSTMLCCGVLLWLIYGVMNDDVPIILSNAITLLLTITLLILKLRHG
ncbi:SemiSWEET transporter [candidate division KSB1 bacterium]|nr:SemiSWEET transporter [candidate division KSB1 bacterium]